MTTGHPQYGLMCEICFCGLTPEECAEDSTGQKWDVCKGECARQAGIPALPSSATRQVAARLLLTKSIDVVLAAGYQVEEAPTADLDAVAAYLDETSPEMTDQELAAWRFDVEAADGLRRDGMPEDGVQHLRQRYISGACASPTAMKLLRAWAATRQAKGLTMTMKTGGWGGTWIALPPKPAPVDNPERYWAEQPPEESARCAYWREQINRGWRPSKHIRRHCYQCAAEWYGVYLWEAQEVIFPLLRSLREQRARSSAVQPTGSPDL